VRTDRHRLAWAVAALLLFAAALVFDLGRASGFSASTTIYPRAVGPYPAELDPAYFRRTLGNSDLQRYMHITAGARSWEYLDARFTPRPPFAVLVTVRAATPARARAFSQALARQIVQVSERQIASQAALDARQLRAELAGPGLRPRARRARRRRLAAVLRVRAAPYERFVEGRPPPLPRPTRWADRLADALPGDFPPRPSPLWAGLAGILLVALVWAIGAAVRSGSGPGGSGRLPPA
jgi:hypothetical protein